MSTFYKLCSVCLRTGEMKSSWVAHNKELALTYEIGKKTEPVVGKVFGATETQIREDYADLSLATSFGILLKGEGVQVDMPFPGWLADEDDTLNDIREAWLEVTRHSMRSGDRDKGVLLDWFTPYYIEGVCDVDRQFMHEYTTERFLRELGIDAEHFYRPELGLGER